MTDNKKRRNLDILTGSISRLNNVQSFDEIPIDLHNYKGIHSRYVEITNQEARTKSYGNSSLETTVDLTLANPVFQTQFTPQEQRDVLENICFEFEQAAKEKLREEFPIIDQLVLEGTLQKQNDEAK